MTCCTYIYRDPKSNVPIYVGKGVNLYRPFEHLKRSTNAKLDATLKKRLREGFDPQPQVILAPSEAEAVEMEMLLIAMIGREDLGLGPLFNLTNGGDGMSGYRHTETHKLQHGQKVAAWWAKEGVREEHCKKQRARYEKPGAKKTHAKRMKEVHATEEGKLIRKLVGEKNAANKVMAQKVSVAQIAYSSTEEGKAAKKKASEARWSKPGARERGAEQARKGWEKRRLAKEAK